MILEARHLSVKLREREVVRGVDLAVMPGEIVAVAGPNGAGKSTLLRALSGLLAPSAGNVLLDGRPLNQLDRRAIGRAIAYLPQERIVHWPLPVEEVVALGRLPHRTLPGAAEGESDRSAIARAIRTMDLVALTRRPATELSGGELARVLLGRALAQEAQILLTDEPAAGLDPEHALRLFDTFKSLAAEGRAIVVVLHDLSLALRFCHRAILMKNGEMLASGLAADVLSEDNLSRAYGIRAKVTCIDGLPVVLPVAALT